MYNIFVGWLRSRQWPPMGWVGRMAALPTALSPTTEPARRPPRTQPTATAAAHLAARPQPT